MVEVDSLQRFHYIYQRYVFRNINLKQKKMKKIFGLLLLASLMAACNGGGESAEVKTDSTAVAADSTVVVDSAKVAVDSVKVEAPAETK